MWWRRQTRRISRNSGRRFSPAHSPGGRREDVQGRGGRGDPGPQGRDDRRRPRRDVRSPAHPAAANRRSWRFWVCSRRPTTGQYWLNGRAVDRLPQAERARIRNIEWGWSSRAST